jgi:hypothetical protein
VLATHTLYHSGAHQLDLHAHPHAWAWKLLCKPPTYEGWSRPCTTVPCTVGDLMTVDRPSSTPVEGKSKPAMFNESQLHRIQHAMVFSSMTHQVDSTVTPTRQPPHTQPWTQLEIPELWPPATQPQRWDRLCNFISTTLLANSTHKVRRPRHTTSGCHKPMNQSPIYAARYILKYSVHNLCSRTHVSTSQGPAGLPRSCLLACLLITLPSSHTWGGPWGDPCMGLGCLPDLTADRETNLT